MKIDKASKQADLSILAFIKDKVELMTEVEYNKKKYFVVCVEQATVVGLPYQIKAVPESQFPEDYKTLARVGNDFCFVTREGVQPMSKEDKADLYTMGIHSFAKKHGLNLF